MKDEILTELYISRTNNPHKMAVFKVEFLGEERINKIANKIKDSGLIPFAIEKCDKVYHLYFYGESEKARNVCRVLDDVIICGRVEREKLGSTGCIVDKVLV